VWIEDAVQKQQQRHGRTKRCIVFRTGPSDVKHQQCLAAGTNCTTDTKNTVDFSGAAEALLLVTILYISKFPKCQG